MPGALARACDSPCPNTHQVRVRGGKSAETRGCRVLHRPVLPRGTHHGTHVADVSPPDPFM